MAIISKIGRKSFKVRALYFGMYAFLMVGAASMVYPFMLMISGSTKGAVDTKYFDVVPQFLKDDAWLYRKHVESLFSERMSNRNIAYGDDGTAFETIVPPADGSAERVAQWEQFLAEVALPPYAFTVGHLEAGISRTLPLHLRGFKAFLRDQYGKSIDDINAALGTEFVNWSALTVQTRLPLSRRDKPADSAFGDALYAYQAGVPLGMRVYASVEGYYKKAFLKPQYSTKIAEYNRTHGTQHASYDDVPLPRTVPLNGSVQEQDDWEAFVRSTLAMVWLRADDEAAPAYRAFLQAKHGTLAVLNKNYGTDYASFDQVPLVGEPPSFGLLTSDWEAFLAGWRDPANGQTHKLSVAHIRIHSLEFMFRDWRASHSSTHLQRSVQPGGQVVNGSLPQAGLHYAWFQANRGALKSEFITRNYKTVAEYLLLHGRGIYNTVIYCALAVLLALTINPLAAYAMSRYKMPSSYKILLFLMCTMAFPPMVTQIPNFLMLRNLGLLNTFAALVLPGMANGYAIFLLKGFFDAQPRELYESAQIDGASEWTIFWQITMSLSKPILAVIALQAFTMAYSNFMFAFVVCQDQKMWTLMVWLYQLQQRSGQAVMYASLIIAAIPTFFIFLFCQNIIMRGIVVPSEK
jgi:multiple sugar transport system permease protein